MIKKFEQYNESLRDKMVGKSDEELDLAYKNVLNNSIRLDEYSGKLTSVFQEISNLMGDPLNNLYYLDEEKYGGDELWDYFADYLEDVAHINPTKIFQKDIIQGQWYCYPHKKLAWWGYGPDGILGWVFTKKIFKQTNNESFEII